jgi:hypothetical protein
MFMGLFFIRIKNSPQKTTEDLRINNSGGGQFFPEVIEIA